MTWCDDVFAWLRGYRVRSGGGVVLWWIAACAGGHIQAIVRAHDDSSISTVRSAAMAHQMM